MKKKIIGIMISGILAAAMFAGCGGGQDGGAAGAESASASVGSTESADTASQDASGGSQEQSSEPADGLYKIALSNSYMENGWRQEMEAVAEIVAESEPYASRCTLDIYNTENTAEAQSASIESLITMDYDAIIIDCASDTGVNTAIDQAVDSGIVVVSFDSNCTTDKAYKVILDAASSYAFAAEYISAAVNYEGNLVMDRGIPNTSTSKTITDAVTPVFESYPGLKVVAEYDGEFNEGTTQNAFSTILATQDVDVVFTQSHCVAIENACLDAGVDPVPANGDAYMSNMKSMLENDVPGVFVPWYVGCSAVALDNAIRILDGEEVDKEIILKIDPVVTDDTIADLDEMVEKTGVPTYVLVEEGVNYSPDWPDQFLWPALPADFPVQPSAEDVIAKLNG